MTPAEQHERRLARARRDLERVAQSAQTARNEDLLARLTVDASTMVVDARNGLFPYHSRALDLLEECVIEWRKYHGQ